MFYGWPPEVTPKHINYIRRRFKQGATVDVVAKEMQTYSGPAISAG